MADGWNYEKLVPVAVGSEWPQRPIAGLRAYSFVVDRQTKRIWLKAHLDQPLSDEEQENFWEMEGAIEVDLSDDWRVGTEYEVLTGAQEPKPLDGGFLFQRGDVETPRNHWERHIRERRRS